MTGNLAEFLGLAEHQIAVAFWVFIRIGAAIALLPVLGESTLPVRVKLALTLALTVVVAPAVEGRFSTAEMQASSRIVLFATEVGIGLVIGLYIRLFVIALQVAGAIAAQSTSLSQAFAGASVEPQPAFGNLLVVAGLALMVTLKLHVVLVEYLVFSYQVFGPGGLGSAGMLAQWGAEEIQRSFRLAFSLAAPFVIASLIYNIALGAINRAMPQLMVSFVGAPVVTAGGLALLFLASPIMLAAWSAALMGALATGLGSGP